MEKAGNRLALLSEVQIDGMTTCIAFIRVGWSGVRNLVWVTAMLGVAWANSTQLLAAQNAAPGSVDPSFPVRFRTPVAFVLEQSNGHLLVADGFGAGTNLMRLTADGAYDPTFAPTSGVTALALQSDGKLVAGSQWGRGVRRLLPDGSLDSSFSFAPPYVHPRILDFYFWCTALAVQPDGRILISGYRIYDSNAEDERYYWAMPTGYRLLPDGRLDSAFTPFPAAVRALAVLADDRILVAGADLRVLHADGTRDTNFVAGPFSPRIDSLTIREDDIFATTINCFAIQPDGRILVGGSFTNVQGHARWYLARVLADGRLDVSFNPPAFTAESLEGARGLEQPRVNALAVQADGRILVGGVLQADQSPNAWTVVRLNPDGSLDATFSPLVERYDDDEEELGIVSSIVIQDQTRAVIGGGDLDVGDLFRIHLGEPLPRLSILQTAGGIVQLTYSYAGSGEFAVLTTTNITLPGSNWTVLGSATNMGGSRYQFTDQLSPSEAHRFYRLREVGPR